MQSHCEMKSWRTTEKHDLSQAVDAAINRLFSSSLLPLSQDESSCNCLSYENEFDLHNNGSAGGTYFHTNGSNVDSF